jgi:DNA-binding FrmR family transcriptional regulator
MDQHAVSNRLKRIEGQIRGIQRMLDEGKSCSDVLDQISAARTALHNTGVLILAGHASDCLLRGEDRIEELIRLMKKLARS